MPTSACPASRWPGSTRSRPETAALLARNRALANAFFAGRDDLEGAPMVARHHRLPAPAARRCRRASTRCFARDYDTVDRARPLLRPRRPFPDRHRRADRDRRGGARAARRRAGRAAHEEGRHRRILPPARRPDPGARDRARIGQRLYLAGRRRAVGAGDRRRRQPRHPGPVRRGDDARSRCSRSARKG